MRGGLHVVIAVPPLTGHVIPSLGLAAQLSASGHRVTYVTHGNYRSDVVATGAALVATTVLYEQLSEGFIEDPVLGPILSVVTAGTAEIEADLDRLTRHFELDPADVICVGYASQIGFALADRMAVPRVTLYSTYAWNGQIQRETYGPLVYEGMLGNALEKRCRVAGRMGFSPRHPVPFGPPSSVNLVPIPRFFQYYPECFGDDYVFMGPCIDVHPGTSGWKPRFPERPLLYISLGTTYNDNPTFFRSCIEHFGDGEFEVAMSVGSRIDIEDLGKLPDNVEIRRFFPQVSVLRKASVFLSHAGMGSTMEALLTQVPIVAVPQQGDQRLNARRIQELGLGLDCSAPTQLDMAAVASVVRRVNSDEGFRQRLSRRSAEVDAAQGLKAGVTAIASLC